MARRRRMHLLLPFITLLASTTSHLCHSALLTNIYNNKLSEITDLTDRYLLVPNPQPAQESTDSMQPAESLMQADSPMAAPLVGGSGMWKNNPGSGRPNKASLSNQSRLQTEQPAEDELPNPNINNLGHEITKIIQKFFQHGYDKRVRPNYSGPPALINISIHIIGISSVNEVQMDFTTDFYFRQKWFDPRLEFQPIENLDELCLGAEFAEKIWLPDTFFANEKTATFHKATTENTFIRIGHKGRVYRSIRLTVTCSCPMELQYFPMDRQRCKIEIESYGYNTRDIDYRWGQGGQPVTLNEKIELPQFKVLGFKMGQEVQNLSSGDYIRLYCEIHFVRSMGYYLIQIYIPASLIVMISWVSFWLHRNATPARVALGVTTVLTMTTLMSSTNAALPKISYIKSIDVFLGTCFVMVFASLLEYASVGYIGKRIAMKRKRMQDLKQMQQHHQKVCVAAAASAAAANQVATGQQQSIQQLKQIPKDRLLAGQVPYAHNQHATSQTLNRQDTASLMAAMGALNGSQTMRRSRPTDSNETAAYDINDPNYAQRSSIKVMLNHGGSQSQQPGHFHADTLNPKGTASIKRRLDGTVGPVSDFHQHKVAPPPLPPPASNQPISEAEVHQTQDTVKVCGLTPSAIDKHSRVIFPICFICFNLMYWIIYGHISQQIEDKGPPLIPVMKN